MTGGGGCRLARVGISTCFSHPNPDRGAVFRDKTLLYVELTMYRWVQAGGALTFAVPPITAGGGATLADYVAELDGLVLHGGADLSPRSYGQEPRRSEWTGDEVRDRYELELVERTLEAGKPILGICRGHQVLNVAFGGTLHQDLPTDVGSSAHRDPEIHSRHFHDVELVAGGGLAGLYPAGPRQSVNSVHHQAICELGAGLQVEARADDGVVEAVRADGDAYVVGVQWHPEFFTAEDTGRMDQGPLRAEFLDRVAGRAGARLAGRRP